MLQDCKDQELPKKLQDCKVNVLKIESRRVKFYKHSSVIAHGTFGIVYAGKDTKTDRDVAIKRIFKDDRYINRELEAIKLLNRKEDELSKLHVNILPLIYDYQDTEVNGDTYTNIVTPLYQ